ncbi:MAG: hypothetical protein WBC04_18550 [Candidatus Acidiferrales bacterium]
MEIRGRKLPSTAPRNRSPFILYFFFLIFWLSALGGCAAPGEPSPRRVPVPEAVADLSAQQMGDDIILTFTQPKNTVTREPLPSSPTIEIYRGFVIVPVRNKPTAGALKTLIATIPQQMVGHYLEGGRVRYVDSLKPEELEQYSGAGAVYSVRTRVSKKKESADSNLAAVRVALPAEPMQDPSAQVTDTAILLSWTAPQKTTAGTPLTTLAGYHVYRGEAAPGASAENISPQSLESPLALLEETQTSSYRDTQFEFSHTYVYSVRSIVRMGTNTTESADSKLLVVTPKDVFPPSAPQGLVVVYVPAVADAPAHLELSWPISPEPDIAGYNVYRSEEGIPPKRLNPQLLLTPAFRDMSAMPGRHYTYSVTAVDRAGNESPASSPVSVGFPDANQ